MPDDTNDQQKINETEFEIYLRVETCEEMLETAAMDTAISEAEKEFAAEGTLLDARETLSALRR